jgi:hypothetical protein
MANVLDGLFGGVRRILKDGTEQPFHPVLNLKGEWVVAEGTDGDGNPTVELTPPAGAVTTTTSLAFTQPAVNSNVAVTFDSTAGMAAGAVLYIEDGGYYQIVSIADATHATLKNLGYTGNAAPAATVPSGGDVIPGGVQGPAGASGVVGNAQPSLRIFTVDGVQNIASNAEKNLTDYPYNAKASVQVTTGTGVSGSPVVTLASAIDFANRDGIFLSNAGPAVDLITPAAPVASVRGTAGATLRTYYCVGMSAMYGTPIGSAGVAVANTNATLSETDYVRITPPMLAFVDGYVRSNVPNLAAFPVAQTNRTYIATDRVVLIGQTNPAENGIYTVGAVGAGTAALTRASDFDSAAEVTAASGFFIPVRSAKSYGSGFAGGPRMLQVTSGTVTTLGADPITFSESVEWILIYALDSRTAGLKKIIGSICTRTTWYTEPAAPVFCFDDTGATFPVVDNFIPNTLPTAVMRESIAARIIAGAGTTSITLDRNVSATGGYYIRHDNSLAIQEAFDAASANGSSVGGRFLLPSNAASYCCYATIECDKQHNVRGDGPNNSVIGFGPGKGLRIRGATVSRYGSAGTDATFSRVGFVGLNTCLPAGGDFVAPPYDGHGGTYDGATQLYTGGAYTDTRRLSYVKGAMVMLQTRARLEQVRVSICRGNAVVVSGTSDDDGTNANDFAFNTLRISSATDGHGVVVTGYDASAGRCHDVLVTGADQAGIWDDGFTGSYWTFPHTESCYLAGCCSSQASTSAFFGGYLEGGMLAFRLRTGATWIGGNPGTLVDSNGGYVSVGGTLRPGVIYSVGTTPNRVYRKFGETSVSSDIIGRTYTESPYATFGLFERWNALSTVRSFEWYFDISAYVSYRIAATSAKIYGGVWTPRGILQGPEDTARRAWRAVNGVPGTTLNHTYEPGDFLVDINTGRQIQVRARCVSSNEVWAAATGYRVGTVLVPTSNNALNRGFVCTVNGTSGGAQPNWDAVADNGTVTDGGATWMAWGTTGSAVPNFDLPLEAKNGPNLVDTNPTLQIGNGARYCRRAGVQTAPRTATLGVTGVEDGDMMIIECEAHATHTLAFVDGGSSGLTLYTVPAARAEVVSFRYDLATTQWKFAGKVRA